MSTLWIKLRESREQVGDYPCKNLQTKQILMWRY